MTYGEAHSAIVAPAGTWWVPAGKQEKRWVVIAFIWCLVLFAMMPLWHFRGGQNPSGVRAKVNPTEFAARVEKFVADYKVGEDHGVPVVAPPPGSDVYMLAQMWRWYPVLKLKEGAQYTLHLSSVDLNHGFSLFPVNVNFQVVPGYDYGLKIVPNKSGDFRIVCNEFCGVGHHMMVGKIVVE
jgi:cytochrome c oxidase subunit II